MSLASYYCSTPLSKGQYTLSFFEPQIAKVSSGGIGEYPATGYLPSGNFLLKIPSISRRRAPKAGKYPVAGYSPGYTQDGKGHLPWLFHRDILSCILGVIS
jgi:hypothetical protein